MNLQDMKTRLEKAFPGGNVEVFDLTGGEDHWEVLVKSTAFQGKSRIEQQRMVMDVFKEELKTGEVHALTIKTQI